MTRLPLAMGCWIVVVWVALWGEASAANVLGGVLVAAVLLRLFPPEGTHGDVVVRLLPALRFAGRFVVDLLRATTDVAWDVVTPRSQGDPGVVAVSLPRTGDAVLALVADAVTLTPGTLTLEVERRDEGAVIFVHVLHLGDPEAVRRDVRSVHGRAVAAFGSESADGPVTGGQAAPGAGEHLGEQTR